MYKDRWSQHKVKVIRIWKNPRKEPTSEDIQKATKEYIANGGIITKVVATAENYEDFISQRSNPSEIDDFLKA